MNTTPISAQIRIIAAVAVKDITDAVRNKAILSTMFSILLIIAMYQWGPGLIYAAEPPELVVYDAGNSRLVTWLEESTDIVFRQADSQQDLEDRIGFEQFPTLGIVLPPDFDRSMETAGGDTTIKLAGYVDHWVTDEQAMKLRTFFEPRLSELAGNPVHINVTRDIFTRNDGGNPFTVSLLLTVILTMISITTLTHLMIEEKETRTMDALLVSPATPLLIMAGKTIAGLFYCLSAAALVLLLNQRAIVHWPVIILASLCGAIFSTALGIVMGNMVKNKQQISLWGFILLQPLILPVAFSVMPEIIPEVVIKVLHWIPTVALADVIRLSFVAQAPLSAFAGQLLFILACTAALTGTGVWLTRRSQA